MGMVGREDNTPFHAGYLGLQMEVNEDASTDEAKPRVDCANGVNRHSSNNSLMAGRR